MSGVINKKAIDITDLKHITFVAYEWAYDNDCYHNKSTSQQLELLKKGGFNTVSYKLYTQLTEEQPHLSLNLEKIHCLKLMVLLFKMIFSPKYFKKSQYVRSI